MVYFNIFLGVLAFLFMEFVAWSNHKYIMHGFLWRWHLDHHHSDRGKKASSTVAKRWEKNDLFFLLYALPAIVLLVWGFSIPNYTMISIGFGITAYGFIYFMFHDVFIHRRLNIPWLYNSKNAYLKAMQKAHSAHHWGKGKRDFKNYGLLVFSKRYFNQE